MVIFFLIKLCLVYIYIYIYIFFIIIINNNNNNKNNYFIEQIASYQSEFAKYLFNDSLFLNNDDNQISIEIKKIINLMIKEFIDLNEFKQFELKCNKILINNFINNKIINNNFNQYLWISVVLFSHFMRLNFVGPFNFKNIKNINNKIINELLIDNKNKDNLIINLNLKSDKWLRIDNEDIEFQVKYGFLLILSKIILKNGLFYLNNNQNIDINDNDNNKISWHWWYFRSLRYHQYLLSNKCPSLQNEILLQCEIIEKLFNKKNTFKQLNKIKNNKINITFKQLLNCQFNIEYGIMANYYWKHEIVNKQINFAKQLLSKKFIYKLTSKMGKRTKWQKESLPQLYIDIQSSIYSYFPSIDDDGWYLPINVELKDDTLLNEIKWDDDDDDNDHDDDKKINDNKKIHYLEQCILLFECNLKNNINKIKDMTELNILAYLDVLNLNNNINDWSVQIFVFLERCNIEFNNFNKQSRSIQQYENIINHYNLLFEKCRYIPLKYEEKDDNNNNIFFKICYKRLKGIYGLTLKSYSKIECELGDLYFSLGFIQSALRIYEKLKYFDKIIICLVNLQRINDAKQMLLNEIKKINLYNINFDKKPYYLCLLGDITKNINYYKQAWNISNNKYGKAMRCLSLYYYKNKQYEKCIKCSEKALSINSLFPKIWFILGSSGMKIKPKPNYEIIIKSFSFIVSIDSTNFEAWNNLGVAHMNLLNYSSALYSLQYAGNLKRNNWRIWENILTCCIKLKILSKSISTLNHLINIKKNTISLNSNIINLITMQLIQQKENNNNNNNINKSLIIQFDKLIENILNRLNQNSFLNKSSHEHESPFTTFSENGLKNDDDNDHNKQSIQFENAINIYQIFSIYFEKTLRIQQSIEIKFKQIRMMMKYFENLCKINDNNNNNNKIIKKEYIKIVNVLNKLIDLYLIQINDNNNNNKKNIKKLQEILTSIQLILNRAQRLSHKLYIDLKENLQLTQNINKMEKLIFKIKDKKEEEEQHEQEESICNGFSDWM